MTYLRPRRRNITFYHQYKRSVSPFFWEHVCLLLYKVCWVVSLAKVAVDNAETKSFVCSPMILDSNGGPKILWHRGPKDPRTGDPRTRGPGTQGPEDPRTGNPRTRGPEDRGPKDPKTGDPRTRGPEDRGPKDRRTQGPEDPRTWGPEDRGPKDPDFWGLCCTVAVKIQLYGLSVPVVRA